MLRIGMDVGSTTLKCVVLDSNDNIIYKKYERHFAQITSKSFQMLAEIASLFPDEQSVSVSISGSAGMGLAEVCGIHFEQEVYATKRAVSRLLGDTDTVIELGGEDAKILFLKNGLEVRMNGSCAGGTGAFIDQMATLLDINPEVMNELAKEHRKIYTVASRCGVFAKSDIQPLLNQGAQKSDVSASIFAAVVNQTIAGLAQGRDITGRVIYLGGPLTFLSELRKSFDEILKIQGICPDDSLYYVAIGAALSNAEPQAITSAMHKIENYQSAEGYNSCPPLFADEDEYNKFRERHSHDVEVNAAFQEGNLYLGVDAGSTTVKAVAVDDAANIVMSAYLPNNGNAVELVKTFLEDLYEKYPAAEIVSSAVTGYGEELVKNAFTLDYGLVETVSHFTAAKWFQPQVDFIIDIGGQDIKCFKIRNGTIDNIFLNEACSSGCGSFLQTFAAAWDYSIPEFARMGLFADSPVDLGSRCTVFMNSSVKQAQKDGASIENISAGLSVSVVKNAIYKVIRAANANDLGQHIVVQGGTFLNDAVLRSFEQEIGREVIRPSIAGLMGAFGAALYAKSHQPSVSTTVTREVLKNFKHQVKAVNCNRCPNNCCLTVNSFDNGRSFIGGNRCDKPLKNSAKTEIKSLYDYKLELLSQYTPRAGSRGRIGIPMGLNMYELLPFWHTLFSELGFEVSVSPLSNRELYLSGQHTIPSDTVCYPAKLMHGHIEKLLAEGVDTIFYPCMSYNVDEGLGDNNFNCPVVAYYPEVLYNNISALKQTLFFHDYFGIHRKKDFIPRFYTAVNRYFGVFSMSEVRRAAQKAYLEYDAFMARVHNKGREYMRYAKQNDLDIIILAGRPYHTDPEVNHGIDHLICELGAVVITEDAYFRELPKSRRRADVNVLNQWSYHARLYACAQAVANDPDPRLNFIQLVSFGCGLDAVTTDECRSIIEKRDKIYTQIKIDEITNLGAVKIRLRSLFAANQAELDKKTAGEVY